MRILIAEDDKTSQLLLNHVLSPVGAVDIANDGLEAIAMVENSILQKKPYDLICLDILMPKLDGFDALSSIREIERKSGLQCSARSRVIVTSTLGDPQSINRAYKNECDAYMVKPIIKKALLQKISDFSPVSTGMCN